jgi:hypothetical protein
MPGCSAKLPVTGIVVNDESRSIVVDLLSRILIFDSRDLWIRQRIPVLGSVALQVDEERGLLFASQYYSGTVAVF